MLLEFITQTKALEYLIGLWFVAGFIAIWQLVYGRGGRGSRITMGLMWYLMLGLGIVVASCISAVIR